MHKTDRLYYSFAYRLSRQLETRPRLLKWYRHFCFTFLKPRELQQIPIFINNRNHYTYLSNLIDWLKTNGFNNYYVIDNDSSYPPLLDYYQKCLKNRVIFLNKNAGHLSIWKEGLMNRVKNSFFIYTDSDVLPALESNPMLVSELYMVLKKYDFALKAGCAIKIDDLPNCFSLKSDVVSHEDKFWKNKLEPNIYRANVDTTFALYLPNYFWQSSHWDKHIRVSGSCSIRHQPWYQDTNNMTEEQEYYQANTATKTHWTKFLASSVK